MATIPTYQENSQIQVPTADMSQAQAAENKAKIFSQIAQEGWGITQKAADQIYAKKGQQDADKEGAAFKPALNLTEAGRAYNQAGAPVAKSIFVSQMQNSLNSIYLKIMNQPVSTDSKTGNLAQFGNLTNSYLKTLGDQVPEEYKGEYESLARNVVTGYGMRIADKQANWQAGQTAALAVDTTMSNENNASNVMYTAAYNGNEEGIKSSYALALEAHNSAIQNGHLRGVSEASVLNNVRNTNKSLLFAKMSGTLGKLSANYKFANPAQRPAIENSINKYISLGIDQERVTTNKDDNRTASSIYSPQGLNSIRRNLSTQFRYVKNQYKISAASNAFAAKDYLSALNHGGARNSDFEANQEALHPEYRIKVEDAIAQNSVAEQLESMPAHEIQAMVSDLKSGKNVVFDGYDKGTSRRIAGPVSTRLATYYQQIKNDPANQVRLMPGSSEAFTHIVNGVRPLVLSQEASTVLQQAATQRAQHPESLLTSTPGPDESKILNQWWDHSVATQKTHLGLKDSQVRLMNNASAKTSVLNLVGERDTNGSESEINQLAKMRLAFGAKWKYGLRSLIKPGGLGYAPVIQLAASLNTNAPGNVKEITDAADEARRNPDFFSRVGKIDGGFLGKTDGHACSFSDFGNLISLDPTYQHVASTIGAMPGPEQRKYLSALRTTIAQVAADKAYKSKGASSTAELKGYVTSASTFVLQSLYQNAGGGGPLIPHSTVIPNGEGGSKNLPLHAPTLQAGMTFVQNNPDKFALLPSKNPDLKKLNSIYLSRDKAKSIFINGSWQTTPDGSGAQHFGSDGKKSRQPNGDLLILNYVGFTQDPPEGFFNYNHGIKDK
jgi:hypothetical protein